VKKKKSWLKRTVRKEPGGLEEKKNGMFDSPKAQKKAIWTRWKKGKTGKTMGTGTSEENKGRRRSKE